eukprot:623344-Pleurochrysis_carterae.AAC.8
MSLLAPTRTFHLPQMHQRRYRLPHLHWGPPLPRGRNLLSTQTPRRIPCQRQRLQQLLFAFHPPRRRTPGNPILLPPHLWPTYSCHELDGRGWLWRDPCANNARRSSLSQMLLTTVASIRPRPLAAGVP